MRRFNFKGHPGTVVLLWMVMLGALAGIERGGLWPLYGALIMLSVFGPIYVIGAYNRPE